MEFSRFGWIDGWDMVANAGAMDGWMDGMRSRFGEAWRWFDFSITGGEGRSGMAQSKVGTEAVVYV